MELDDIWCVFTAVFERSNTVVLGQNKASCITQVCMVLSVLL